MVKRRKKKVVKDKEGVVFVLNKPESVPLRYVDDRILQFVNEHFEGLLDRNMVICDKVSLSGNIEMVSYYISTIISDYIYFKMFDYYEEDDNSPQPDFDD
jgi:hypothetical protein